ncbi:hypothetical protein HKX48_008864 [Thoreauomyces humboldtii]|nr:hypothetical protein HKX48_008864 [Thoreauomyces humboldtii]
MPPPSKKRAQPTHQPAPTVPSSLPSSKTRPTKPGSPNPFQSPNDLALKKRRRTAPNPTPLTIEFYRAAAAERCRRRSSGEPISPVLGVGEQREVESDGQVEDEDEVEDEVEDDEDEDEEDATSVIESDKENHLASKSKAQAVMETKKGDDRKFQWTREHGMRLRAAVDDYFAMPSHASYLCPTTTMDFIKGALRDDKVFLPDDPETTQKPVLEMMLNETRRCIRQWLYLAGSTLLDRTGPDFELPLPEFSRALYRIPCPTIAQMERVALLRVVASDKAHLKFAPLQTKLRVTKLWEMVDSYLSDSHEAQKKDLQKDFGEVWSCDV